jgi:hypothetical protein
LLSLHGFADAVHHSMQKDAATKLDNVFRSAINAAAAKRSSWQFHWRILPGMQ